MSHLGLSRLTQSQSPGGSVLIGGRQLQMGLREKLILLTTLGVLAPLFLVIGIASWLELRAVKRDLLSHVNLTAVMVAELAAAEVSAHPDATCAESFKLLARRSQVKVATLYGTDGRVHCSYTRAPDSPRAPSATEPPEHFEEPRIIDDDIEISAPAVYDGRTFGRLYLKSSTDELSRRSAVLMWGVGTGMVGLLLFIFLFAFALERVVSRPILALAAATRQVTVRGDYSTRVVPTSGDEIGALASEYNKMIAEIERRTRALVQSEEALKESYDELARTQMELVQKERLAAVGELAAVMAHEVRNPLGAIFNSIGALERRVAPTAQTHELFVILREEADRLTRIVEDLLDFARPHSPDRRPVKMDSLIASAVEVAYSAVPHGRGKVQLDVSSAFPAVPVDERMIRQVFINLVVNALQSAPGGALVRVAAHSRDGQACFEVADEGQGIEPSIVSRVFQPFFTTKARGTGLGLAVVQRFVEAHGGRVEVVSRPKLGSTFTVALPQRIPAEAPMPHLSLAAS